MIFFPSKEKTIGLLIAWGEMLEGGTTLVTGASFNSGSSSFPSEALLMSIIL